MKSLDRFFYDDRAIITKLCAEALTKEPHRIQLDLLCSIMLDPTPSDEQLVCVAYLINAEEEDLEEAGISRTIASAANLLERALLQPQLVNSINYCDIDNLALSSLGYYVRHAAEQSLSFFTSDDVKLADAMVLSKIIARACKHVSHPLTHLCHHCVYKTLRNIDDPMRKIEYVESLEEIDQSHLVVSLLADPAADPLDVVIATRDFQTLDSDDFVELAKLTVNGDVWPWPMALIEALEEPLSELVRSFKPWMVWDAV